MRARSKRGDIDPAALRPHVPPDSGSRESTDSVRFITPCSGCCRGWRFTSHSPRRSRRISRMIDSKAAGISATSFRRCARSPCCISRTSARPERGGNRESRGLRGGGDAGRGADHRGGIRVESGLILRAAPGAVRTNRVHDNRGGLRKTQPRGSRLAELNRCDCVEMLVPSKGAVPARWRLTVREPMPLGGIVPSVENVRATFAACARAHKQ